MYEGEKMLTFAEAMKMVRVESRATMYKLIVPLELKQLDPIKYRHFLGYIDLNPNGAYKKRRFPRSEVEAYCKRVNIYDS